MKQILILLTLLSCLLLCNCKEESLEGPFQNPKGKLAIKSNPSGARIYLQGNDTGKNTPDSLNNLETGNYDGYLFLQYYDTAFFSVTISANITTSKEIALEENLPNIEFTWDYSIRSNGDSVQFSFQINQDVILDSIIVSRPVNNAGDYTTDENIFNKQLFVWRDQNGFLVSYYLPISNFGEQFYPRIENFLYRFDVYGQQAHGNQNSFYSYYLQEL